MNRKCLLHRTVLILSGDWERGNLETLLNMLKGHIMDEYLYDFQEKIKNSNNIKKRTHEECLQDRKLMIILFLWRLCTDKITESSRNVRRTWEQSDVDMNLKYSNLINWKLVQIKNWLNTLGTSKLFFSEYPMSRSSSPTSCYGSSTCSMLALFTIFLDPRFKNLNVLVLYHGHPGKQWKKHCQMEFQ